MMMCRKCESRINTGTKCYQCGHDNSKPLILNPAKSKKNKKGPVLIAVMSLFILLAVITIAANIGAILRIPELANITLIFPILFGIPNNIFFVNIPFMPYPINPIITIGVAIFEIFLCISILRLEKKAFKIYVGLIIILSGLQLINILSLLAYGIFNLFRMLLAFILKGLLLLVVHMTDGKLLLGGTEFNDPISAILTRKKREKEKTR